MKLSSTRRQQHLRHVRRVSRARERRVERLESLPPPQQQKPSAAEQLKSRALHETGQNWPPRPLFVAQSFFSLLAILVSSVQIYRIGVGCESGAYLTLLSTIISLWVPNPKP